MQSGGQNSLANSLPENTWHLTDPAAIGPGRLNWQWHPNANSNAHGLNAQQHIVPNYDAANSSLLDSSIRSRFSPGSASNSLLASGGIDSTNSPSTLFTATLMTSSSSASASASASAYACAYGSSASAASDCASLSSSVLESESESVCAARNPSALLKHGGFESELEVVSRFERDLLVVLRDRFELLEIEAKTFGRGMSARRSPTSSMLRSLHISASNSSSSSSSSSSSVHIPDCSSDESDDKVGECDENELASLSLLNGAESFHSADCHSELKKNLLHLHRQLMSLQVFATANNNQFSELLEPFARQNSHDDVSHRYTTLLQSFDIPRLNELIASVESAYAKHFLDGNASLARITLRDTATQSSKQRPAAIAEFDWQAFDIGLRFGFMILLLIWVCWDCIVDARLRPSEHNLWIESILPIYRGVGAAIFLGWCFSIMLYILTKYKINFVQAFTLETRQVPLYSQIFEECTVMSILYLVNFLIYFKILRGDFPSWVPSTYFPIALFVYLIIKIIPWGMSADKRTVWWRAVGQVLMAPFGQANFFTGYVGDVITSLVRVINDLAYASCYTLSGDWRHDLTPDQERPETCLHSLYFRKLLLPLLSVLPLWFRFMQCLRKFIDSGERWPNLVNAGKYALAHTVVLFGVFHSKIHNEMDTYRILWILSLALSTIYAFLWDVYQDWGLGNLHFKFLRNRIIFQKPLFYYSCIVADLFLRFAWTLTLLPYGGDSPLPEDFMVYLQPILAAAEICRRTMWSCLRLEFEHINPHRSSSNVHRRFENSHLQSQKVEEQAEHARRSGWRIIVEVTTLALLVLAIGFVAVITAN